MSSDPDPYGQGNRQASAFLISVIDHWSCAAKKIKRTDDMRYFTTDPDAMRAKAEAEAFVRQRMEEHHSDICGGRAFQIPSFWSGSESTEGAEALKALGKDLKDYPIPQNSWEAKTVMGGIEWRIVAVSIDHCCCLQDWSAEVAIVDKLGWEADKYGDWWEMEWLAGKSREFERGRFMVSGSSNCCE